MLEWRHQGGWKVCRGKTVDSAQGSCRADKKGTSWLIMDSAMTWRSAHSVGENCNPTSCLAKLTIVFLIITLITCDNANTNCPLMLLNQDLGEFGHLVLTLSHLKKHMQDTTITQVSTSCSLFIREGTCKCNFTSMLSCTLLDKLAWDFCRITVQHVCLME